MWTGKGHGEKGDGRDVEKSRTPGNQEPFLESLSGVMGADRKKTFFLSH